MSARFGFHRVRKNFAYILCVRVVRVSMQFEVIVFKLLFFGFIFGFGGFSFNTYPHNDTRFHFYT
jgi:hypothetical protein